FFRQLEAPRAQDLEKVAFDPFPRNDVRPRSLYFLILFAAYRLHELDFLFALHHLPRREVEFQDGILVIELNKQILADELEDPVADHGAGVLSHDGKGAELIVLILENALAVVAAQDGNDVIDAEAFLEAGDGGQDFLGHDKRVLDRFDIAQAQIARAAGG